MRLMSQPAIHAVMSDAEYERERERLREVYGDSRTQAAARWEQALATLFYRSGWTQEKLAAKEGKEQRWISRRVVFGRFLNSRPDGLNPELPLTEGKFRKFWDQTEGDERERFKTVARMLKDEVPGRHKGVAPKIIKQFGDGKWHRVDAVAEELEIPRAEVEQAIKTVAGHPEKYKDAKCEQRHRGTEFRIFPTDKTVSAKELIEKLDPIVKGLEEQGRKNQVTMSVSAVAVLAAKLRKLLHEWAE